MVYFGVVVVIVVVVVLVVVVVTVVKQSQLLVLRLGLEFDKKSSRCVVYGAPKILFRTNIFWTPNFYRTHILIVKLQSKVQTSVLGLGVDFVLPLSQEEEEEEEEEEQQQQEPHQNIPEGNILEF